MTSIMAFLHVRMPGCTMTTVGAFVEITAFLVPRLFLVYMPMPPCIINLIITFLEFIIFITNPDSVCVPTASKGKDLVEHLCEGVTYLSTQLQYSTINVKADNEGTMMKLKQVIQKQRAALGLGTVLQDAVSGQKETNGMAERHSFAI